MSVGVRNRHRVAVNERRDAGQLTPARRTSKNLELPTAGNATQSGPAFIAGAESN